MRSTSNTFEKIVYWFFIDKVPVTKFLIVWTALSYVLVALFQVEIINSFLAFTPDRLFSMPWTAFTYPLAVPGGNPFYLVFTIIWLWFAGGSLERSWSSRVFAWFFFGMSVITAIGLYIGAVLSNVDLQLLGMWMPLAGVTVAFAMLNPEQQIMYFFVIPLKLKYLALIDVVIVFLTYAQGGNFILGTLALLGCAFSYWYVMKGRSFYGRQSIRRAERDKVVRLYRGPSFLQKMNPFRRLRDRREQKRLKDFFDKSGFNE